MCDLLGCSFAEFLIEGGGWNLLAFRTTPKKKIALAGYGGERERGTDTEGGEGTLEGDLS